jgi:pimeloyl-ACP methyl ester carboxylesterase
LLFVHAIDATVLQVEGETSVPRRATYLVALAVAGVICSMATRVLGDRSRAIALLSLGLVGLTTIGPILGSYVDKLGFGGSRFTGALALLSALILVVAGTSRLMAMARTRWRKLLAIPIALVIVQFFMLPVATAVFFTQAARPTLGTRTPTEIGFDYETVRVTSGDGTELAAWYIASSNGAAVVLRHGSGSTRINTLDHARFLAEAGFGVLMTDARGHGESEGRINEVGWHGPEDIAAAVDYLEQRPDVTAGIGILGLSMGGEEALNAAGSDERIEAVVAEGVGIGNYNDSVAAGAHVIARFVNWTQFAVTDLLSDAPQPAGVVASMPRIAPRPVLLIAGDVAAERSMGSIYAEAGGSTTELWMLDDTPHTDGLRVKGSDYEERVLQLFDRALVDR